jgi:hypothetical protein
MTVVNRIPVAWLPALGLLLAAPAQAGVESVTVRLAEARCLS